MSYSYLSNFMSSSYLSNICFNLRKITLQSIVFENWNVQFGNDWSGVPTYVLSLNSTIKMMYKNPSNFLWCSCHVNSFASSLLRPHTSFWSGTTHFYTSEYQSLCSLMHGNAPTNNLSALVGEKHIYYSLQPLNYFFTN